MQEIEAYIQEHETQYQGKYYHQRSFQKEPFVYKFHYYMRDIQLRQIDIYLEINYQDQLTYHLSEKLHHYEEEYIVVDALKRIRDHYSRPSILHSDTLKPFIEGKIKTSVLIQDYIHILNYLKYHHGLNQKTIDQFYHLFMPYMDDLFEHQAYFSYMDCFLALMKEISYEYLWQGATANYLDSEYQFHLYYIRLILEKIYQHFDVMLKVAEETFIDILELIFQYPRLAFSLVTLLEEIIYSNARLSKEILKRLESRFEKNHTDQDTHLVYDYYYARYYGDDVLYHDVLLQLFRNVMNDILTLTNHDIAIAIGNVFLSIEGYDILIDLFEKDYNSYVFVSFPLETIPKSYYPRIRYELENAVRFYAARMKEPKFSLSSFEQVADINRLLMRNFKEENE